MNIKKVTVSLLAAAMLAGCGGGSAAASSTAASGSKDIDEIKMQFVPSRDAETILKQTTDLPQLLIDAMKEKGYNTNKIRTEGLLSQSTLQKFRNQQGVSWENLETLCRLLECQPGDLIEYVEEDVQL